MSYDNYNPATVFICLVQIAKVCRITPLVASRMQISMKEALRFVLRFVRFRRFWSSHGSLFIISCDLFPSNVVEWRSWCDTSSSLLGIGIGVETIVLRMIKQD
jgi:hypothetical protein